MNRWTVRVLGYLQHSEKRGYIEEELTERLKETEHITHSFRSIAT
jgi:hypothetical protein